MSDCSAVIARVAAALSADDADEGLSTALAVLAEAGIGRDGAARAADGWDEGARAILASLLRSAEVRVAERDAHRRTQERLDALSAASFEGIMIHDQGVILDANQRLAEMLGYDLDEVIGAPVLALCVAPEDMDDVLRRVRERQEGAYVITGVRKDGTRFRAELSSKQGHLGARPVRFAVVRDVTERERTSQLLRESEARLRGLVEVTFDFFVMSRAGVVVDVGGRVEATMGLPGPELIGRELLDFVTPDAQVAVREVLTSQRVGAYETTIRTPDGREVPIAIVAVAATLNGEPVRLAGVRDLRHTKRLEAERRRLEQRLERSQRLDSLGVLAGGIAHDFNNLLVGVLANAEILVERVADPSDRGAAVAIVDAASRAASLTSQMLAYAGGGKLSPRKPLDLGTLLHEVRALLAAALSKKAVLTLDIAPRSVVVGDRATLTQVLMNLLTNASDALADRPGRIAVTTRRITALDARWDDALGSLEVVPSWIVVEVRDDGIGMDAATRARAFEPFFSTKPNGHGLGLAACFGIVSSHGGAIHIESALGEGSCFSLLLPESGLDLAVTAPDAGVSSTGGRRVLVVDDEQLVRSVVQRALTPRGYIVMEAVDGIRALEIVDRADVLLVDLTMPGMDGLELIRRIRDRGVRLPVVLASGYLGVLDEHPADREIVDVVLTKPFGIDKLVAAIERALALGAARAAAAEPD